MSKLVVNVCGQDTVMDYADIMTALQMIAALDDLAGQVHLNAEFRSVFYNPKSASYNLLCDGEIIESGASLHLASIWLGLDDYNHVTRVFGAGDSTLYYPHSHIDVHTTRDVFKILTASYSTVTCDIKDDWRVCVDDTCNGLYDVVLVERTSGKHVFEFRHLNFVSAVKHFWALIG